MACLLLTILIMASYYCLISCRPEKTISNKILQIFLLTCTQIIVTELILGLTGWLYVSSLAIINIAVSSLVLVYSHSRSKTGLQKTIKHDVAIATDTICKVMDVYNIALLVLVILSYSWVIIAAYYLPLRGVDDLSYHLPAVFEYIQTHTIKLLPIEIRFHFAFPQNAELLFLWPTIFSHSQKMLDSVNVPFVLISIVVVYSLLRNFMLQKNDALFAALLYALCPVVLMQAGSNYIDVLVSLFFLLSLYYTIRYFQCQRSIYAWLAGMSIGIVCGMKYTAFFLTIPLQMIILWKLFTGKRSQAAGYFAIVFALCGWWYLRNAVVLGNPFYPMNLLLPGMGFVGGNEASAVKAFFQNISYWVLLFPFEDIGIGSYDGGFGLVFWGLGLSSWICVTVYSILYFKKTDTAKFIVLMQLPIGLLMLLFVPKAEMPYVGRYSIFVVAIGLFTLSKVFELIQYNIYKSFIKIVCILFSILTVCLMFTSTMPSYRLENAFSTNTSITLPSEYTFSMNTNPIYPVLKDIWNPLDYLTKDDRPGINCYIASNKAFLVLSPFYGGNLQNRPITIGSDVPRQTEAFVYLHYPPRDLFGNVIKQDIYYPKSKISMQEALSRPEYAVITQSELGCLIMSRAYLNNPAKLKRLRTYYGDTWPESVTAAEKLKPFLKSGVPVVTSNTVAYGLRYLELGLGRMDGVVLVPTGNEEHVARSQHILRCYTLDKPLHGYVHDKIATVQLNRKSVTLYLNYAN
jgi:Dolichyl-phosphate-mannose-protein mannosyltransferase